MVGQAKIHGYFARKAGLSPFETACRVARVAVARRLEPRAVVPVRIPGTPFDLLVDLSTVTGRRIAVYGITDYEIELLRRILRPGELFVDMGANVGVFSLAGAAAVGPTGRVIACEASAATHGLLERSIAYNNLGSRITSLQTAVSDHIGEAEFFTFEAGSGLSSFAPRGQEFGSRTMVPTTTLDAVTKDVVQPVGLVKIDVEGAELWVARGGQTLLSTRRPPILVEVEPDQLARQGATVAELQGHFEELGYMAYWISPRPPIVLTPIEGPWHRPDEEANVFLAADHESVRLASRDAGGTAHPDCRPC